MKPKGRPKKTRLIERIPKIGQFSPRGRPGRPDEIKLSLDQFEAVRLVDCLGQKHSQAANQMGISRQTTERILKQARKLISDAIINGKIIRISGGKVLIKKPR